MIYTRALLVAISVIFLSFTVPSQAQSPSSPDAADNWERISSNDGEFSVEVPANYSFLFDANGFIVGKDSSDYEVKNMYALTTFYRGTLISFESFDGRKGAFDALYDADAFDDKGRKTAERKIGKAVVKDIINRTDTLYCVRTFIRTDGRIYILTAANRTGETPEMTRFLNSLKIRDTSGPEPGEKAFSAIKPLDVKVYFEDQQNKPQPKNPAPPVKKIDDPTIKPLVIIRGIRASYVGPARDSRVSGKIRIRMTMEPNGSIPDITVLKTLPEGLLRQAVFAALRTKFIPKEKDGLPIATKSTFEFGFHIY